VLPTDTLLLAPDLTIETWMRPQGSGIRTIFAKSVGCVPIFALRVNSNGYLEIAEELSTTTNSQTLTVDIWTHIAVTAAFNSGSKDSTISFYQNGLPTYSSQTAFLRDFYLTASYHIGMKSGTDYFQGFIWSLSLRNSLLSAAEIAGKVRAQGCPSDFSFCLSPASFLQTAEGTACLPACEYGCVRPTDCSLCADRMCSACETFERTLNSGGSCLQGSIKF